MKIAVKRVYEEPSKRDGTRVLVDRLWPRGVSKQSAALDRWLRDLAPSDELRHWFHAYPSEWRKFRELYLEELGQEFASRDLAELYRLTNKSKVTLLFASRNEEHNNAVVLKELIEGARKPPTGTGPAAAGSMRIGKAARGPKK
jgi:uncharacterized protein YeaO (DUF488 family)